MDEHAAFRTAVYAHHTDDAPALIYADWCEEQGLTDAAELLRGGGFWMMPIDRKALMYVAACRFVPGTQAKRFARDMNLTANIYKDRRWMVSPKQWRYLWLLAYRFRRQLKASINMTHPDGPQDVLALAEQFHKARQLAEAV